jgi:hypothetical protein
MAGATHHKDRICYRYTFQFATGEEKNFEVLLNSSTLELVANKDSPKPHWTKLKYHQCANCPLGDEIEHCPVAVNLSHLVETFKDSISFESTSVLVQTPQRNYQKQTTLQKGLSSIIGIYMVTSNCPVMDKLRPNVRFHLPFASTEETIYRAVSMYLTEQYFLMRKGETPDWELKHLAEIYHGVNHVNKGISRRLSNASNEDANVNAVIVLSTFGDTMNTFLEDSLNEIDSLLHAAVRT